VVCSGFVDPLGHFLGNIFQVGLEIRYSPVSAIFLQLLAVSPQCAYNANMSSYRVKLLFPNGLQRQTSAIAA
jgi:hypothetical protein